MFTRLTGKEGRWKGEGRLIGRVDRWVGRLIRVMILFFGFGFRFLA